MAKTMGLNTAASGMLAVSSNKTIMEDIPVNNEPAMQTELGKPLTLEIMGNGRFQQDFERELAKAMQQHDEYMRQNPGVQKNKTVLTLQIEFVNVSNPHSNRDDPDAADQNPTAITPKFSIKGMAPKPATYYGYSKTADPSQGAFDEADAETGEVRKSIPLKNGTNG